MPFQEVYLHRFLVAREDTLSSPPCDNTFLVISLVAIQCFALCLSMYMLYKSFKHCQVVGREPGNEQPKEEEEALALIQVLVHDQLAAPSPPLTPRFSRNIAEPETCSICLGEYAKGEEVRLMPRCRHLFHKACIDSWLVTVSSCCPICAKIVTSPIYVGIGMDDRLQN